ncbi:ParB/RepB/Spo0J family partition protein [Amycolatopsis sp. RTGN1]|uniref:ParB/RepB/Spo0J family partition protein n=1 Tax=Amycolatopsis ponsaeliensis TaxID=2992142 RepID=UPI00254AC841|nr:ParB N-terminal domain-containing protein [Amycolatopsis sp. RTGN1]
MTTIEIPTEVNLDLTTTLLAEAQPDRQVAVEISTTTETSGLESGDFPHERSTDDVELLEVAPDQLFIGANTRRNVVLDKDFVRSIARHGVREPIRAYRDDTGKLVVHDGQRRTLAAIRTQRERVRVIVEPRPSLDEKAQERRRIVDQVVVNRHRADICGADQVQAAQQLLDLGLDARAIARECSIPVKEVETTIQVATSDTARKALNDGTLDLTQAAVVAEFQGDEAAEATLTECARTQPEQFSHQAQRLRDRREERRLRQETTDKLQADGVTVIARPDTLYGGKTRKLTDLRATPQTKPGTKLTAKRHTKCPGHAAFLDYRSHRPEADRVEIVYVCTSFTEHGHAEIHAGQGKVTATYSAGTGRATGPMTEEEKANRRRVIQNGKDWDSAEKVRKTFLKNFAGRKSAPKDATTWIAQTIAEGSHDLRKAMESDHALAVELLGLDKKAGRSRYDRRLAHPIADAATKATPSRATVLNLVMLLAALEEGTDRRNTWEKPSPAQRSYFTQLKNWGYALSPVEELVLTPSQSTTTTPVELGIADDGDETAAEEHGDDEVPDGNDDEDDAVEGAAIKPTAGEEPGTAESVADLQADLAA